MEGEEEVLMKGEFDRMAALMALDDILEVYPVKDEAKQAQRTRRKAHIIAWVVAELAKGPCLQG